MLTSKVFFRSLDWTKFVLKLALVIVPVQVLLQVLMPVLMVSSAQAKPVVGSDVESQIKAKTEIAPKLTSNEKLQDPTRPPSVIVQQLAPELALAPEYELTAIFTRNNQQYAVVNGTVLKKGDSLANMLVSEISATSLTFEDLLSTEQAEQIRVLELRGAVNIKKQVRK